MQDLISVVVPVYNCGPYLDACLRSLTAQTWQNWEAILVDDGSTDDSPALCDAWAGREPRVRALHQKNRGVSAARNAGMAAARGQYLAFVDADDWVEPEFLQVLRETLGSAQLAVCCVYDPSDWNEKVRDETIPLAQFRSTPSRYANPVYTNYPCNKLFLADIIRQNGICFPENVRRCEDANFVADYLLCCKEIAVTTRKLYHYVQREGSAMHSFYEGVCDDEIPLMQKQYELFHGSQLTSAEETAFQNWEYGKVLAILRYIVNYSSKARTKHYIKKLFSYKKAKDSVLSPPKTIGLKGRMAARFIKNGWYGLLCVLLRYI